MKKNILTISALLLSIMAFSQINVGSDANTTPNKNAFLDASGFTETSLPSLGKGLNFPRTNLTTFAFDISDLGQYQYFKTGFDGMVVYNTATGKTGTNTATQGQQVDVTPGFYYFANPNATEDTTDVSTGKWVRLSDGASQDGQEWVYNPTNKRIELKRSGTAPFNNTVFYNNATGQFYNTDFTTSDNIEYWDGVNKQMITKPFEFNEGPRFILSAKASKIGGSTENGIRSKSSLNANLILDGSDSSLPNVVDHRTGVSTGVSIYKNYNNSFRNVIGLGGNVASFANSGSVQHLIGVANGISVMQGNLSSSGYALANRSESYWNSTGAANRISAIGLYSTLGANAGNVNALEGINGIVYAGGTGTINEMSFIKAETGTYNYFTGTLGNLYGFKYIHKQASSSKPTNMYGIYLDNVNDATDNNYAIYTNLGKVHFGDEVNVVGSITATSIKGSNGATIFPDYVFQKYYTGTSSLKADYSFKTLSQVEDFVKINGHLPGYQSAEAIKEQGYIDLMATQLTNVEKIEELYLHLLEKDKEVKALKAEITELKSLVKDLLAK
ncbi:hypothetical protein [Riemerella anatipestifer]|uniref:hypothetical protein n=1 Tax=Riemerella anatipestifer TaxID=34085 RepID=UPI0013753942|nr:hypothetical protein [Riemerella anatipestifer]